MHCSQLPCQRWRIKKAFLLYSHLYPFHFRISAEFSQKRFPLLALSLCIATLLLWEFEKQMRGVKPIVDIISFFKYVQSLLEWSFFSLFSFPMWRSFLQIVDIPSKIIACSKKKKKTDVFIPKSLLYCLPCPHTKSRSFVMPLVTGNSQKGFSGSEEYGEGTKAF